MNVHPFYNYFTPQIRDVSVIRCDSNGAESVTGSCIRISASRLSCFDYLGNDDGWISCIIRYRYRLYESAIYSDWVTIPEEPQDPHSQNYDPSRGSVDTGVLNLGLSADKDYEVMVGVLDSKGSSNNTSVILYSGNVFMHKDGEMNSISIGETVTEKDTVSIASKITAWVKGLLKIGDRIDFYDSNGVKGAYAKSGVIEVFSSDAFATITPNYIGVGTGAKNYVSMNYDSQNKRGYISIDGEPLYSSHAVNKAYVDGNFRPSTWLPTLSEIGAAPADITVRKQLSAAGWYKVGTLTASPLHCGAITLYICGQHNNSKPPVAIVDAVIAYNSAKAKTRIAAGTLTSQVTKVGLIAETASKYGVYVYYAVSKANQVIVSTHTLGGKFASEDFTASTVEETSMKTVANLNE